MEASPVTMDGQGLDNDTRGWIMCLVSAAACVVGSSIIYVDVMVRLLPFKSHFSVQESKAFLACSLSLSFGVMLFSALNGMLPSAKRYLQKAGYSDQQGGLLLVAFFVAGFFGIQIVSRFLHQFMPSHVVGCNHTHDEPEHHGGHPQHHAHHCSHHKHSHGRNKPSPILESPPATDRITSETTPLLGRDGERNGHARDPLDPLKQGAASDGNIPRESPMTTEVRRAATTDVHTVERRPSMVQVQKRVLSFVKDAKQNCDETGPCYGFSAPCGQECRKQLGGAWSGPPSRNPAAIRASAGGCHGSDRADSHAHSEGGAEDSDFSPSWTSQVQSSETEVEDDGHSVHSMHSHMDDIEAQHHHHVHNNAFLSIGLQTSIAIALHKFPEGFITYATNHANPVLGFNVFTALFVHNITEGFALALPLYLALGSRWRAMLWASILGGLSQPIGAGIAVLWFHLAKKNRMNPSETVYACLFAITAGIMVSVALQLFVESLSLNHNRNLSIFCAFVGMVILGLSNALVNGH